MDIIKYRITVLRIVSYHSRFHGFNKHRILINQISLPYKSNWIIMYRIILVSYCKTDIVRIVLVSYYKTSIMCIVSVLYRKTHIVHIVSYRYRIVSLISHISHQYYIISYCKTHTYCIISVS